MIARTPIAALGLALALAVGCASSPPGRRSDAESAPPPPPPTEEDRDAAYDFESEGDFPLPSRDVEFEEDQLPPPESVDAEGFSGTPEPVDDETLDTDPVEPSVRTPVPPSTEAPQARSDPAESARGWRVQLAASSERAEAERLAREAGARLSVAVYVDREGDLFKVRAGDFAERAAALRLRDRARANGYDGAWIVTTEIVPGP